MAFCRNCGSELAEGARFCTGCGAAVDGDFNPIADETITPINVGDASKETVEDSRKQSWINKFNIFFGVILFLLALVDYYSDPPAWTILLSVVIIVGAIFCLSQKYKFKIFTIMALLIAVFCLWAGVCQGNRMGFFKVPADDDYVAAANEPVSETVSEVVSETVSEVATEKAEVVEKQENTVDEVEQEQESLVEEKEEIKSVGGVDPELKAFLDSYEAFMDEYVDFMKKYTDGSGDALAMLTEYTQIMAKYEDFAKKADAYDTNEMSTQDAKYYLEVMNRCNQKMLDIY